MEPTLSDSLATNLQQSSADQAAPYVVQRRENYVRTPVGFDNRINIQTLSDSNRANYALLARTKYGNPSDISFKEVADRTSSVRNISLFTGLDQYYVNKNYDSVVQKLYPNSAPSPAKINENFNAMLNNAWLIRDLNDWYYRYSAGDKSVSVRNNIEARLRNLKPTDEYIRLMPEGSIKRELEEAWYGIASQYPNMHDQVSSRIKGGITGALVTASTLLIATLASPAVAVGGATLGAVSALSALGGAVSFGAHAGGAVTSWDQMRRQSTGSNFRQIEERLKLEGINVDHRAVRQISAINGAMSASLELLGDELLLGLFKGGGKALTQSLYKTMSSQAYADQIGNIVINGVKKLGKNVGQENLTEITQEIVEWVSTEAYFDAQGSDTAFDITLEEFKDTMWMIVRDTTANTLVYGGIGTTIGTAQDVVAIKKIYDNKRDFEHLTPEQRTSLESLPNDYTNDVKYNDDGNIEINLPQEVVDVDGAVIHSAMITDPVLGEYISPAQNALLARYIHSNPTAVKLTEALALRTGYTDLDLQGIAEVSYDRGSDIEVGYSNFMNRIADGNPDVLIDGTPMDINTREGFDGVAMVTTRDASVILKVEDFGPNGATTEVVMDIQRSGGLTFKSKKGKMLNADIKFVLDQVLPGKYMFDKELTIEFQERLQQATGFVNSDIGKSSLRDLDGVENSIDLIREEFSADIIPSEDSSYTRKIPVVKTVKETYWEDQEVEDDVFEDTLEQPAIEPEEVVEAEPNMPVTSEKLKATIFKAEEFLAEQEELNRERAKQGKPPKDIERYRKSLARMRMALSSVVGAINDNTLNNAERSVELAHRKRIAFDLERVFDEHKAEKIFQGLLGVSRKTAIINTYFEELSDYTKTMYSDQIDIPDLIWSAWSIEAYEEANTMEDAGFQRTANTITPEERADGIIGPEDITVTQSNAEVSVEPAQTKVIGKEKKTIKVKKTRIKKVTTMQDVKFDNRVETDDYSQRKIVKQIIDDADILSSNLKANIVEMILLIRSLGAGVITPEAVSQIRRITDINDFSLYTPKEIDLMLVNEDGAKPQDIDIQLEQRKGQLENVPFNKVKEVYKQVLGIARTDMRLSGYKIGNIEMGYQDIMKQVIGEIGRRSDGRGGFKGQNKIGRAVASLYEMGINYDLLVEKIKGKKSMFYRLLYKNPKESSQNSKRFKKTFNDTFTKMFTHISGVTNPHAFYSEIMYEIGDYQLTREMLLTFKQHMRAGNGYNWRMIRNYGFSFIGKFQSKKLPILQQSTLFDFVENYEMDASEQRVIDVYQEGMDILYDMANTRHQELYGRELEKAEFYIALRPDPSFDIERKPIENMRDEVSFAFAPSNVSDRLGTSNPILIKSLGDEFDRTSTSISEFFFTYRDFKVAENIITNPIVKQLLTKNYHDGYHDYLVDGLQRWVGQRATKDSFDTILDFARIKFGAAVLTVNPEVSIKQVLSFPFFGVYVDMEYLSSAVVEANLHPHKVDRLLKAWSSDYYTRQEHAGNIQVHDQMTRNAGKRLIEGSDVLEDVRWGLIRNADKNTIKVGMYAAMQQVLGEIERGYFSDAVKNALDIDEEVLGYLNAESKMKLAAEFAEYALQRTQPMQDPEHVSTFQRKSSFTRALSAFGTYTNNINNLMYRTYLANERGEPGATSAMVTTFIMAGLVVPAMTGFFDAARRTLWQEANDTPEWRRKTFWQLFGSSYFSSVTGYWFVVRDLAKALEYIVARGGGGSSGIEPVLFEMAQSSMLGTYQLFDAIWPTTDDDLRKNLLINGIENVAKSAFYWTGLPAYLLKPAIAALERAKD